MNFFVTKYDISTSQIWLYNIALMLGFAYLFWKYRKQDVAKYVIFLFTIGITADLGRLFSLGTSVGHVYLVIATAWAGSLIHKYGFKSKTSILMSFLLYAGYFIFVSLFVHSDNVGLVVSQTLKYTIPVMTFFVVDAYIKHRKRKGIVILNHVIHNLVLAQILFCVIKLMILRATQEGWVGSLTGINGGGAGTSFPLLGLLWLSYITKMRFSRKYWFFVIGLLFIGFMTGKRAVWLLFPMLFGVLYLYYRVSDYKKLIKYIVPAFMAVGLFMYLGLRLSPTLNPEKKVWGPFDLGYAYNYAMKYSGGTKTKDGGTEVKEGDGRLGAALLFWNRVTNVWDYDKGILLGYGNESIRYYEKEDYTNRESNMGVRSRGALTGILFVSFAIGLIGVFLFFNYMCTIFRPFMKNKYVTIIFVVMLFDFVFYNAQIIRNVPMQCLMFILCALLNVRYKSMGNQRVNT